MRAPIHPAAGLGLACIVLLVGCNLSIGGDSQSFVCESNDDCDDGESCVVIGDGVRACIGDDVIGDADIEIVEDIPTDTDDDTGFDIPDGVDIPDVDDMPDVDDGFDLPDEPDMMVGNVDVELRLEGMPLADADVLFHDIDGFYLGSDSTDGSGRLDYPLPGGGMVTFILEENNMEGSHYQVVTFTDVGPGQRVAFDFEPLFFTSSMQDNLLIQATNSNVAGGNEYWVTNFCDGYPGFDFENSGTGWNLIVEDYCLHPNDSMDVVAWVTDPAGQMMAYTVLDNLPKTGGNTTVGSLPPWQMDIISFDFEVSAPPTYEYVDISYNVVGPNNTAFNMSLTNFQGPVNQQTTTLRYGGNLASRMHVEINAGAFSSGSGKYVSIIKPLAEPQSGFQMVDMATSGLPMIDTFSIDISMAQRPGVEWAGPPSLDNAIACAGEFNYTGPSGAFIDWHVIADGEPDGAIYVPEVPFEFSDLTPNVSDLFARLTCEAWSDFNSYHAFLEQGFPFWFIYSRPNVETLLTSIDEST